MLDLEGTLRIGEVARLADVNIQTLRYYERRGILDQPERSPSGYRQYPVETVELVRTIKRAQKLGFSLDEIERLLRIREGGNGACTKARDIAADKLQLLNERIEELAGVRRTLEELIRDCQPRRPAEDCGVLTAISNGATTGSL
jgi:DNA-binding transcriptional MerR regulator